MRILRMLLVCFLLTSCGEKTYCPNNKKINVALALQEIKVKNGEEYCSLVYNSLNGNEDSILKLVEISFSNEKNIELHGEVLIQVINYLGEEEFLTKVKGIDQMEKIKLYSYIAIGFVTIEDKKFKNKNIVNVFPMLSEFLLDNKI